MRLSSFSPSFSEQNSLHFLIIKTKDSEKTDGKLSFVPSFDLSTQNALERLDF